MISQSCRRILTKRWDIRLYRREKGKHWDLKVYSFSFAPGRD
jgi:hypothetical protein